MNAHRIFIAFLVIGLVQLACGGGTQTAIPPTPVVPTSVSGIADVTLIQHNVRIGPADGLRDVADRERLQNYEAVNVTDGGEAQLDFAGEVALRVFNDSSVGGVSAEVLPNTPTRVHMKLERGGLSGQVVKDGGTAEFEIGNGAFITILGTQFFIIYDAKAGVASVGNFDGTVNYSTPGTGTTSLPSGKMIDILADNSVLIYDIPFTRGQLDAASESASSAQAGLDSLRAQHGIPVTGSRPTPTPTGTVPPTPTPTPTTPPTPTPTASSIPLADLIIPKLALNPSTPSQGNPVSVSVGVYNQGSGPAGAFTVRWWPGAEYSAPGCTWRVDSLAPGQGTDLACTYAGYPSWYSSLTTTADADFEGYVTESNEGNNTIAMGISVSQLDIVHVTFDAWPDGTPITSQKMLKGEEFVAKGIILSGAPLSSYCSDGKATAIRMPYTYGGLDFNFLTTASYSDITRCNTVPVSISFTQPVRWVTLIFAGATANYTLTAYESGGKELGAVQQAALFQGGTTKVTFNAGSPIISRVTFGYTTAVTAIKEIIYSATVQMIE